MKEINVENLMENMFPDKNWYSRLFVRKTGSKEQLDEFYIADQKASGYLSNISARHYFPLDETFASNGKLAFSPFCISSGEEDLDRAGKLMKAYVDVVEKMSGLKFTAVGPEDMPERDKDLQRFILSRALLSGLVKTFEGNLSGSPLVKEYYKELTDGNDIEDPESWSSEKQNPVSYVLDTVLGQQFIFDFGGAMGDNPTVLTACNIENAAIIHELTDIMSCAEEPFGEEKRSDYVPNIRFLTERM